MPASERPTVPRLLIDTNVLLDAVSSRAPWAQESVLLLEAVARGRVQGFVAGHAVTTVHYVVERAVDSAAAVTAVSDVLGLLTVVAIEAADFQRALAMGLRDYEDAVQAAASLKVGADYLVTRNARDFRGAPVTTRTAGEILALLTVAGGRGARRPDVG